MPKLLLGYDVEMTEDAELLGLAVTTNLFLERAAALHKEVQAPATLFCVGKTLERNSEAFQEAALNPFFDLQQHTYSHVLLKTVCITQPGKEALIRGESLEVIETEIEKTNRILEETFGIRCIGLTGPWCYYRGLQDRPDILEILKRQGIHFVRSDGRNEFDWHPVPWERQAYWYDRQGFPEILEFPIQGWQDCVLREEIGWENHAGYLKYMKESLDAVASLGLDINVCQHDWSSLKGDPEMRLTRALLEEALQRGFEICTYRAEYDRRRASRELGKAHQ